MLAHGTGTYWEKAAQNVDLKALFPLKLNLWITINGTKDPTWLWSKHFNKLIFSVTSLAKLSLSAKTYILIKLLMEEFQRFVALWYIWMF